MDGRDRVPRSVLAQYVALALAWGASFLFIKIGLEGLSPAQVVLGRLLAGAVALGAVTAWTRHRLPREAVVWAHLGVVAVLLCVVPFLLFAWAEVHISSGLASIYNATTPLMTALVAVAALPAERLTPPRLAGLVMGFAGVVVVLGPWRGLGTGLAFVWNTNVVAGWGVTNASTVTYLTPLVGVVLGVLVLAETVAWNQPVGALVVCSASPPARGAWRRCRGGSPRA